LKTLLVIPNYNHNSSCTILIDKVAAYDTLIVDDGSTTPFKNESTLSKSKILRNSKNMGKGYSIKKGAMYAISNHYTHMLTIDADLQHDPIYIKQFIENNEFSDLVYGKRSFKKNMPFFRRLSNSITSSIISLFCNLDIFDSQCGYRLYNLELFKNLDSKENGYQFESEILLKKINKYSNIGYVEISTIYNSSKSHINNTIDTLKFIILITKNIFK
tara:strand:+ start:198 stop:845 length:648 start_codon:yes stop_codon:yes gene_type:complete